MPTTPGADDDRTVASHTLAYLRTLDRKLDLLIESVQRQGDPLGRMERDLGETRRDILEIKSDIALLENKVLTAQTEILTVLHRLEGEEPSPSSPGL